MRIILMLISIMMFSSVVYGDDLQKDKDWYLGRKLYESQVRRGGTIQDYYDARANLEKMDEQNQRAYLYAEHIRVDQALQMNAMRQQVELQRIQNSTFVPPKVPFQYPYPSRPSPMEYRRMMQERFRPYPPPFQYHIWIR